MAELLPEVSERLFPVGRLDFDSEGLLFMTNDGDFAFRIQHPRFQISKVYRVKVKGHFTPEHAELFSGGLALEDGLLRPDEVKIEKVLSHHTWLTVSIREGRKRVIRRAMKKLGFQVIRLVRIKIGKIELGNLKPGRYRELGAEEISELLS
ncbi:MAG: pseudouridine synthase [Syntrophales bacterium]|nr:pseudouridine synthase [Syntrophales bacterium]